MADKHEESGFEDWRQSPAAAPPCRAGSARGKPLPGRYEGGRGISFAIPGKPTLRRAVAWRATILTAPPQPDAMSRHESSIVAA